jgi:hypothetical protein
MRIPLAPHSLTTGEALLLTNPHTDTLALYTITNHDHTTGTLTAQLLYTNHTTHAPKTINATLHSGTIKTHPQTLNTPPPPPIDLNPRNTTRNANTETTPLTYTHNNGTLTTWHVTHHLPGGAQLVTNTHGDTRLHLTDHLHHDITTHSPKTINNYTETTFFLPHWATVPVPTPAADALADLYAHPAYTQLTRKQIQRPAWEDDLDTDTITRRYWATIKPDTWEGEPWHRTPAEHIHETIEYLEEIKDLAISTEPETEYSRPLPAETARQIAQHIDKLISTLENTKDYTDEEYS